MNTAAKTYLSGGTLVNEGKVFAAGILIRDGIIAGICQNEEPSDEYLREHGILRVDATGCHILPGVIDDQVHFRDPGLTHKGDLETESLAAVAGGVTSFMDMPNTIPNTTSISLLEEKYALAEGRSYANYSFYLGATNKNIDELRRFDPSTNCGIKAFLGASTGNMLVDDEIALEGIFSLPFLIAIHSEDEEIIRRNADHYRKRYGENPDASVHPLIRSREACYQSTLKAVQRAKRLNTRLHVLHLSTADELPLLTPGGDPAKKRITSEVCVHHLWFSDADYQRLGMFLKWNPAVKAVRDREALLEALNSGLIDIAATDHAPHTAEEKNNSYFKAPSGGPLIQHSLLAMLHLYHRGQIDLTGIVDVMCHKPARCFGVVKRGYLRAGYHADLVMVNLRNPYMVDKSNILYKCGWSPFEGHTFYSSVVCTWVNGVVVWNRGTGAGKPAGRRLNFDPIH